MHIMHIRDLLASSYSRVVCWLFAMSSQQSEHINYIVLL